MLHGWGLGIDSLYALEHRAVPRLELRFLRVDAPEFHAAVQGQECTG